MRTSAAVVVVSTPVEPIHEADKPVKRLDVSVSLPENELRGRVEDVFHADVRARTSAEQTISADVPIHAVVEEIFRLDMKILGSDLQILGCDIEILGSDMPMLGRDVRILESEGLTQDPR